MVEGVLTDHGVVLSTMCMIISERNGWGRDIGRTPSQDETTRRDESGEKAMDEMPSTGGWSTWSGRAVSCAAVGILLKCLPEDMVGFVGCRWRRKEWKQMSDSLVALSAKRICGCFCFCWLFQCFFFPTFLLVIQPLFSHFRTRSYGAQRQVGAYGH